MEFQSNSMLELKIKLAKYAQYKLLCIKTNHLNLLLKNPPAAVQLMEAAKLKTVSEPNRKSS
jgi:hypothetical protein